MARTFLSLFPIRSWSAVFLGAAASSLLCSCFTGIESTKKIEMSRQDLKIAAPSEEESFMSGITGSPLSDWKEGMEFVVADPKISLILTTSGKPSNNLHSGDILCFYGITPIPMPDGSEHGRIAWKDKAGTIYYQNSGKKLEDALQNLTSDRLPMLTDRQMILRTDSLLTGKSLWNKSRIAYTPDGERISILRFTECHIDSVTPGEGFFPLKVWTKTEGRPIFFYMDFNSASAESRPLAKILSLENPKTKYPNIPADHWAAIREGKVIVGMTKDECRLSLGNPSDVNAGRDYTSTIDIWQYPDGTFLRFTDGLLVSFRN